MAGSQECCQWTGERLSVESRAVFGKRMVHPDLLKLAGCLPQPCYTLLMAYLAQRSPALLLGWKARKMEPRCESRAALVLPRLSEDADSIVAGGDAFQTSLSPREALCTILSSPAGRPAGGQGGKSPQEVTYGHSGARQRCQGCWAFPLAALP